MGKYLFGELSFGDLSVEKICVQGIFFSRKCPLGKWSVGELSQNRIDLFVEFSVMLNNGLVGCTAQKMKFSLRIS